MSGVRPVLAAAAFTSASPFLTRNCAILIEPRKACMAASHKITFSGDLLHFPHFSRNTPFSCKESSSYRTVVYA